VLCLIVVPLPPGKYPFGVKINNNNNKKILICIRVYISDVGRPDRLMTRSNAPTNLGYFIKTSLMKLVCEDKYSRHLFIFLFYKKKRK
jgi:hypothetical protein